MGRKKTKMPEMNNILKENKKNMKIDITRKDLNEMVYTAVKRILREVMNGDEIPNFDAGNEPTGRDVYDWKGNVESYGEDYPNRHDIDPDFNNDTKDISGVDVHGNLYSYNCPEVFKNLPAELNDVEVSAGNKSEMEEMEGWLEEKFRFAEREPFSHIIDDFEHGRSSVEKLLEEISLKYDSANSLYEKCVYYYAYKYILTHENDYEPEEEDNEEERQASLDNDARENYYNSWRNGDFDN